MPAIYKSAQAMLALAGDARASKKTEWFKITNLATGPTAVHIYDEIGVWGVSASEFTASLAAIRGPIDLHLSTPGGEVFDGIAIYNALRTHGDVSVYIDSLAASIGSVIAMAADPGRLFIEDTARMMIHDGFVMAAGNADELLALVDQLNSASDTIAGIYARRTGKPQAEWRAAMKTETWYTGEQAVAAGLADKVISGGKPLDDGGAQFLVDFFRTAAFIRNDNTDPNSHNGWLMREGKWVFDPKDDGDDDYQASTDKDRDYWDSDGHQLHPIPASPDGKFPAKPMPVNWSPTIINADKYKQADRDRMSKSGEAMPDSSYPIADAEDLDNAIHAVGRGGADHDDIRKHIITRAKALGLSSEIPDHWNPDGSLGESPDDAIDGALLLAVFSSGMNGGL